MIPVVCPYTRIHARTREALERFSYCTTYRALRGDRDYWRVLSGMWAKAEPFVLVEHDVELHENVLPELESCPEPWCLFPYARLLPGPHSTWDGEEWSAGIPLLNSHLGCVRWSVELMVAESDLMDVVGSVTRPGLSPGHWMRLDDVIAQQLVLRGYRAHVHHPEVTHHHWLLPRWDQCSCGDPECR